MPKRCRLPTLDSGRIGVWGMLLIAGVSVLSVKDIRVVEKGDCRMRRLLPTRVGDKPPRYIFLPRRGLKFFE